MGIKSNEFRKITKFTDLVVWQEGHKLVLLIYTTTKKFPDCEKFGLSNQLNRAVVSFTSNIAEGFAKHSSKEKNKYYNTSHTSLIEIQNQTLVARDVGYLSNSEFMKIANQTVVCHKLIIGLIKATRINKFES
ncbi:MAG: four helix bundle protein [Parcubacteria group bacterium]|jgi:four helix bundle protein